MRQQAGYTFHCAEMWGAGGDDHPGVWYALAPLTGTPGPANAHENPGLGRSSIHPTGGVDNEATFTTFSLLSLCCSKVGRFAWVAQPPPSPVLMTRYGTSTVPGTKPGIASGIGADSASAASCRTGVIQYVVPHVPPLLRSFPILIVKHHEQQDVEVRNSKWNFLFYCS